MKIKKEKYFDPKKAKDVFVEEYNFIDGIFSRSALPVPNSSFEDDLVTNKKNNNSNTNLPGKSRAKNFEELQSRLAELKGTKGLEYQEKMKKKNLKNQLKKKAKKNERKLKKMVKVERNAAGGLKTEKSETEGQTQKPPRTKPVFNSEGHMVFSKFDFKDLGSKKKVPKVQKDPKKLLGLLKEKQEKIKELEAAGEKEKAAEIKEKEAWKSVLSKASGEKVKDDPELLKRTIKREEKKKEQSAKKWKARSEAVQADIQKRQQKRQENISARKKQKKNNKLKKAAKKGRVIAGF